MSPRLKALIPYAALLCCYSAAMLPCIGDSATPRASARQNALSHAHPYVQPCSRNDTALRNLANYGYQIPQRPDQLSTPSLGDSIRSLALSITCSGDDVQGGSCGDLVS